MTIGILNVGGYFDLLLAQIDHMVTEGFVRQSNLDLFVVAESVDELLDKMARAKRSAKDKWL
jgi:predicted Rossmann-fold nucleotide-binding protein